MKRMCLIAVMFAGLLASCADSIPFRDDPLKPDSLATREYPHAFFIIQGKTTDSISLEPVPGISVNLRTETPVFTEEDGSFSVQTTAFPISQEFRVVFNAYGEHHKPVYLPETLYVHFMLPTFRLTQDEILEHGPKFFGRTYMTVDKPLSPLAYE